MTFALSPFFAQLTPTSIHAATITYVDATDGPNGNTRLASGGVFLALTGSPIGNDNQWSLRPFANGGGVFTTNDGTPSGPEDAPGLVTSIRGLIPSRTYEVFAFFWSDSNNWRLKSSLTAMPPLGDDPSVSFSANGAVGTTDAPTATGGDFAGPVLIGEGNRIMLRADLGLAPATSSGEIRVWIDDFANTTAGNRTWYDGVGYALVPEPSALALASLLVVTMWRRPRYDTPSSSQDC
jgi:hypothetical protein